MSNRDQRPKGANPKSLNFDPMFKFMYHILSTATYALFNFKRTKRHTIQMMNEFEQKYNGKFSKSLIDKTSRYEGIQQIVINDAFTKLVGRQTNAYEKASNKLFFILTFLYDDIMDGKILTENELNKLLENPLENPHNIFEAKVLVDIHLQLLKRTKQPEKYSSTLLAIHNAQKDSLIQFNSNVSQSDLLDIVMRKGGYSFLMCSLYIDLPISKDMDNCWYHIGSMLQFIDDMFDIYGDLQEGIYTYANSSTKYSTLEDTFNELVNQLKTYIKALPFDEALKERLFIQLSFIPAFGLLALDNFKKLMDQDGNFKKFKDYPRKSLIIDMEKMGNISRLIAKSYKIGNAWK